MPLYTLRVRMVPQASFSRGAGFIEMTHHLHWDDDTQAGDALPNLMKHWSGDVGLPEFQSAISRRWVVVQDTPVHQMSIYRRDIEDIRTWTPIRHGFFRVPPYNEHSTTFNIEGTPIPVVLKANAIYRHTRGAVLVRERTADPAISRRVYVGPISPVCLFIDGADFLPDVIADFGHNAITQWWNPWTHDAPYNPAEDSVDFWRDEIRDCARDHVHDINDEAGGGVRVVPSWLHHAFYPVTLTDASSVRAEIRSRGSEAAMSDPVEVLGVGGGGGGDW